jgi:MoxR-like ATPase
MTVTIERLGAQDYVPQEGLVYVDVLQLHPLFDKLAFAETNTTVGSVNLILVGPKGIAKTLAVASWAAKNKVPIITFDCSEDVRRGHLIGSFILRGGESPFVLGPIPSAFEIANEVGKCVLCLEEINALTPQMQKVLNPVGDFRRKVEVPECQRVFRLNPKARLWICGTMNTSVYGGVYELNEDLRSRFRILPVSYPGQGKELGIIQQVLGTLSPDEKKLTNNLLTLAHETRQKALAYALSTRDIIQMVVDARTCGLKAALWLASGKFEGQERDYYKTRVGSIFGEQV